MSETPVGSDALCLESGPYRAPFYRAIISVG